MKRVLLGLIIVVAALAAVAPSLVHALDHLTLTAAVGAQQDPATITDYITRTGEKYHRDGCRYLRQSRIATTLHEAVNRGFGPCSVCKPPTLR